MPAATTPPADLHAPQRLRIAVVTETYPPEVNGVAGTVARVVQGLRDRGHALQLVRPRQLHDAVAAGEPADELLVHGLPIPRYPHLKMGLPCGRLLRAHWAAQPPDVVHIATEGPLGWSALLAARRLGLPVCSDFRTNFHAYSRHYGIGWLHRPIMGYLRAFHNRTRRTLVPTEALRATLAAQGFQRLGVVTRGIDTRCFDTRHRSNALRQAWGVRPGQPVLLYVGRLAPEKNLALLLRAYQAMRDERPDLRLVLVGDGPMRRTLRIRVPDAVFAGEQRGAALAAHYASGDLFLFPSLTETYGNVTPEAMASGLPVLAFNEAAAGQLIRHGSTGLLAPCGDEQAFIRHALRLVNDLPDACRMGAAARQSMLAHGWDRIVQLIESVLVEEVANAAPVAHRAGRQAAKEKALQVG